jgi:hypothetical protein
VVFYIVALIIGGTGVAMIISAMRDQRRSCGPDLAVHLSRYQRNGGSNGERPDRRTARIRSVLPTGQGGELGIGVFTLISRWIS